MYSLLFWFLNVVESLQYRVIAHNLYWTYHMNDFGQGGLYSILFSTFILETYVILEILVLAVKNIFTFLEG